MTISTNSVVSIHYTLTDKDGGVVDSSQGQAPLVYLHGAGNIISGLESELTGKNVGDKFQVSIQPQDGYGEANPELIQSVPKSAFGENQSISVGQRFTASTDGGQEVSVVVTEVSETEITVDGNHPLAGQILNFDVSVESVRSATEDEIAHGHAHGPGGVEH